MKQLRHYCPSCGIGIFDGDCTGESGIYMSDSVPDLCEPCWLAEDALIDEKGTNDLPDVLDSYIRGDRKANNG